MTTERAEENSASSRVGPNAIIQLAGALGDRLGEQAVRDLFTHVGLQHMLIDPPAEMVDQRAVADLYEALFARFPGTAAAVAGEAGARTADYILAHRIPWFAKALLRALPARLAAPLLLGAIGRNAWTFAGTGRFSARRGSPLVIEIANNPLAMPNGVWHVAVFEGLFRALVSPRMTVRQRHCCHEGAPVCRFEIFFDADLHGP